MCGRAKMRRIMLQLTTIFFLISFSLLAVIHYLAIKLFLYWQLVWFDMPMHFFGGAVVALGVYTLRDLRILPATFLKPFKVLVIVFLVACVWEVFEALAVIPVDEFDHIDTVIDLVFGLGGGYVGYLVGNRLHSL